MELEFSHITTRGGDEGKTSLLGGERRMKSELIFEVLGDLDELNSFIGLSKVEALEFPELCEHLEQIQRDLIIIGGMLASPGKKAPKQISQIEVLRLEEIQYEWIKGLEIRGFVLPGALNVSAFLDCSRAVCRRCERHLVAYIQEAWNQDLQPVQRYLNRLSDLLFVFARKIVQAKGLKEI